MLIRSFQQSDKAAIVEISKRTWGGYDQLRFELDELIANPHSYLYVIEFKDRVIAFANLNVIDGGKTGWLEHMRVHYRYRKRGFAWKMTHWLFSEAEALGVQRLRLATTIENKATQRIATRIGMHQVLQMKIFWKGNFRGIRWKDTSVPITACSHDEAYMLLAAQSDFVPEGIITYYWQAFDLAKELVKSMSERFRFWKGEINNTAKSLSFGYVRPFHDANLWCSTIYALDKLSFYSALSHQLQIAKEEKAQGVLCFHSVPFQAAHEIPGLKHNTFSSSLLLFEKHRPFIES